MRPNAPRRPNLHVRIVLLFFVALLPLAVLGMGLALQVSADSAATKDAGLRQGAALVAAEESVLIEGARQTLAMLARMPAVMKRDEVLCGAVLAAAAKVNPAYAAIALMIPDGGVACSQDLGELIRREAGSFWLQSVAEKADSGKRFVVGPAEGGPLDRLVAAFPAPSADSGAADASAVIILLIDPRHAASDARAQPQPIESASSALLTPSWRPVSFYAQTPRFDWLPEAPLFDLRTLAGTVATTGQGGDGRMHVYAAARVQGTDLFVLSGAPAALMYKAERRQRIFAIGFPLILLALSAGIAWFSINRLVLRWLDSLRTAALAYGAGKLDARAFIPAAMPSEIADVARSFNDMAANVQDHARDLENALHDKERALAEKTNLLRELHHRVKNNFQVIASLLALQKRSLPAEQKALLRIPEDRIQALATAYRLSYALGEIGPVDLADLIEENLSHMLQSGGANPALLVAEAKRGIKVDLDKAIPFSLLFAELLVRFSEAAKHANHPARVSLAWEDDRLVLSLTGPPLRDQDSEAVALSDKLMKGFVAQLGGRLDIWTDGAASARVVLPGLSEPTRLAASGPARQDADFADA